MINISIQGILKWFPLWLLNNKKPEKACTFSWLMSSEVAGELALVPFCLILIFHHCFSFLDLKRKRMELKTKCSREKSCRLGTWGQWSSLLHSIFFLSKHSACTARNIHQYSTLNKGNKDNEGNRSGHVVHRAILSMSTQKEATLCSVGPTSRELCRMKASGAQKSWASTDKNQMQQIYTFPEDIITEEFLKMNSTTPTILY